MEESQIPRDLDAEEATLGSLLLDGEKIGAVVDLKASDFYREKNRWVYEAMKLLEQRREAINQITVAHELAKQSKLEATGGAAYMSHLVSATPTTVHLRHYAAIVQKTSTLRELITLGTFIQGLGSGRTEVDEALGKADEAMRRLRRMGGQTRLVTPWQWAEKADHRYGMLRHKEDKALPFGLPALDRLTGGAFGGEFILIGARAGVGKSTLLHQFARKMQLHGNILMAQAEMSESQLIDRDVAIIVGQPTTAIRAGNYSEGLLDQIVDAIGELSTHKIYYYVDGGMTTRSLRAVATEMQSEHGLGAIFVDYLGILKDERSMKSYERVTYISSELLGICNDLDVPMIVAAQLNRSVDERADKRPMLSDLRDSGTLEQDADVVLFLYREDYYRPDAQDIHGHAELSIAKHRQGGKLQTIRLQWQGLAQRYEERA
ncbi:MAG: DnaB-like helicase C-terminal domain-containing protein [Dehalococcoidia bacterium]